MSNAVNKVKRLSTETNLWEKTRSPEQPLQDGLTNNEKPIRASFELPRNWWVSHSTFGVCNKLKKLDLIRLNREKLDKQNLHKPVDWKVADGDYKYAMTEKEVCPVLTIEARRRLQKILFGVALVFAALIILLFSFMASSIKNF